MGHAFYANGAMTDLGVIADDPESEANAINNEGVIVGEDFDRSVGDLRGWVSDNGAALVDRRDSDLLGSKRASDDQ